MKGDTKILEHHSPCCVVTTTLLKDSRLREGKTFEAPYKRHSPRCVVPHHSVEGQQDEGGEDRDVQVHAEPLGDPLDEELGARGGAAVGVQREGEAEDEAPLPRRPTAAATATATAAATAVALCSGSEAST